MSGANLKIHSDASYNCTENLASYAFCVEMHGKVCRYANSLPYKVSSSKNAELLALGHAINFLLHEFKLVSCDSIIVYIDNKRAIEEIEKESSFLAYMVKKLWNQLIDKTGSKKNLIVHVKAHTLRKGKAYEMNDWCDKNARVELRRLVNAARGLQEQVGHLSECH